MAKGVNIPLKIQGLREAREDLAKLNEEFEKVKDDPIESKKIAKEFNELSKAIDKTADELKEAQAAGELLGVKFDDLNEVIAGTTTEVLPLTSQIGEMEDRMYQLAAAGDTSSKEFKALQSETVRLRKVIIETDRSIDTMAENAGSIGGITSAFGELGESVLSLDFKRAGVALKGLGTQFKAFGKVLLANPIFLIVAIVAAIVIAIINFKDKVKILSVAFEFFGKVISMVIQHFKDLLDAIGLTEFAEQDQAEARKKRAEENLKNLDREGALVQSEFDRKIALASAEGKATTELEIEKQKAIIATSRARAAQLLEVIKSEQILGKITTERAREFQKQADDLITARKNAENQIKVLEANSTKEYKEELKKRSEAHKAYLDERLSAERMIQDLELELMEDGLAKEILQNEIKYERLREDALRNTRLTEEEKQQIITAYNELEKQDRFELEMTTATGLLEINNDYEDKIKASMQRITEFNESEVGKRIKRSKEEKDALIANIGDYATQAASSLSSINNLANVVSENRLKKVKEGSKAEEKIRKQMFVRQKALNLAMAAIDGFKAITASLAQAPIAIGPVPNPAGIASLAFASASTAASIAAIAAQRFEGGGSAPSASTPSLGGIGGGGATSSASSTPSFELFGQPNDDNNVSAAASQETTQMTVKAVVVESDITSTQNKIEKMQKNAEL